MDRFSEIIGQDIVVSHLQNALRTGGVSHAYILNGAKGSGRHMIARSFSAALLCDTPAGGNSADRDSVDETTSADNSVSRNPADGTPAGDDSAGRNPADGTPAGDNSAGRDPVDETPAGNTPAGGNSVGGRTEACGKCLSCIQAAAGSNPDIIIPVWEKENSIGVNEIRRIRADVQVKPYRASHKVYILQNAEKMTPAAQNALLKTLEEPPSYAVILLLADGTTNFLPTILSRCVTLPLRPVSEKAVEECLLERFDAEPDAARLCARFSGGSIGRAALLLKNENFSGLRDRTISFVRDITKKDAAEIAAFAREAASEDETQDLIDFLLTWNRDVLVCRSTRGTENLIFTDEVQYIIEAARAVSWSSLQAASEAIFRARRRLFSNVNAELTLQMMLLEIRAAYRQE